MGKKDKLRNSATKPGTKARAERVKKDTIALLGEKPEPVRYSNEKLAMFEKLVLAEIARQELFLKEARDTLADVESLVKKEEEHDTGRADAAVKGERAQKMLNHLYPARERIRDKSYGICRVTGKLIPEQRLMKVLHATTCVEAKDPKAKERMAAYEKQRLATTAV